MNKTVTMNLSGNIFHIEEGAYEKLNKYLSTIKSYFKNSESRDEIMSDIELRIAEMLQEKVSKNKQAVLMEDVDSVIAIMGKPEDFMDEQEKSHEEQHTNNDSNSSTTHNFQNRKKRVFRDGDEKKLGGVCSGIANYFDFDPIWFRAAFAISFFVFGSGFLLYLILWIIIPEAKTTAEKLEMRGEKIDVNNIGKAVNEEFEDFKKKMKDYNSKENRDKVKNSAEKFGDFITDIFHTIFKIFVKIIAVILVVIAVVLMIGLLSGIFGSTHISLGAFRENNFSISMIDLIHNFLPNTLPSELFVTGLFLFLGIPLISIIYSGIKLLLGIKQKNRILKYTFNILWLSGLVILIYSGIKINNDFLEEATVKKNIDIKQKDTLYLNVKNLDKDFISNSHSKMHFKIGMMKWDISSTEDNPLKYNVPVLLNITNSETENFELVEIKNASGANKKEANNNAKNIDYDYSIKDSIISFNPKGEININEKWRNQEIQLLLKVPVGKVVYLNGNMKHIIYDIDNISNTLDKDMVNRRWLMTNDGLKCIDCKGLDNVAVGLPEPPAPPSSPN